MSKKIIIVESPAKSKTISSYFKDQVTVLSSVGHIRDLSTSGTEGLGVDIPNDFTPIYKVIPLKKKVVNELIKKTKDMEVYLATDPDREGEAIAWHLAQVLDLDLSKANRIIFREITKPAILEAMNHPRPVDQNLVYSQEARRILDRIIGFKLSSLLKSKIGSQSAGRVQSVALKLITELEKEINAFIPEEYYTIHAYFGQYKADYIIPKNYRVKKEEADEIVKKSTNPFTVSKIQVTESKRQAKTPFITSTLQQEAVNYLYMSSSRVMSVAQKLYEGIEINGQLTGLITYMRTDSTRFNPLFIKSANEHIEKQFGKAYLGSYKSSKKDNAQDAHEAIRPTDLSLTPDAIEQYLGKDEFKVYKRIYERALASLMAPAIFENTKITLSSNGYDYELSGSILKFDGYLKVLYEKDKDKVLPIFKEGQKLDADNVEAIRKETQPPARYNEASLIKELEAQGIGRPSTYATIIKTLKDRHYVEVKERRFHPTEQGTLTSEQLHAYFKEIIDVDYTSKMEDQLDNIAEGQKSGLTILKNFYDDFKPLLEHAKTHMKKITARPTDLKCPTCGQPLVIRKSKYGEFLGCSAFPKCRYIGEYKEA